MLDSFFEQSSSLASLLSHNPDKLTGDSSGLLLHNPDEITVDLGECRSPHATTDRSNPSSNLNEGVIALQEAIAEHRLTDCLEHLESLGFLVEEQLFCLNLAQHLQRGCGV
jgi:hypothetical protein